MARFTVNGADCSPQNGGRLIDFLRDELKLTSVKNGCKEGACGACMVIIDGKAQRACIQRVDALEGKAVLTVEGLSDCEREVYAYAFARAGAVQCGFCTPGMIMSAKALIDANPHPSAAQVKEALRGNVCRCTGYKKIERAVLLAAAILRGDERMEPDGAARVGVRFARVDAVGKALGSTKYADDVYMDGMLYGSALRSAHPRARVLSIDTAQAEALPGVAAVVTAKDIPGARKIGHIVQDWDVLIPVGGITHYLGDSIALVAAHDRETVERAKALIEVEYEVLEAVFSPGRALEEGAVKLHGDSNVLALEHLVRGDAAGAIAHSAHVVTERYSLPFTEHAFLEPECAVAYMEDECVRILSADQGIYQTRKECAAMLGLPEERVRVTAMAVGGGFGGKEDMSVQHHAALLAYITKRPVKVALTRQESILVHPKRHAMELEFTTACDEEGYLTGMKAVIIADTGAYASLGGPVLQRACTHAAGPYNYQNVDILGMAVYTNNPPAGAFRGFGVTQSCFATECNINRLAELVGISPYEFRLKNAIRPGQTLPNGQLADDGTALVETLEAVRGVVEANPGCGIACALKNAGLGVGNRDVGRCRLAIESGKVRIYSSAACIGQGMGTVLTQLVCEETGLPAERVEYMPPDTALAPNAGNTTASRQTLFTGEACARAARALASAMSCKSLDALEGESFYGEYEGVTDPMGSAKENPVSHIAYGYATHVVVLNDDGTLNSVTAAHDVGRAINPTAIEGQIEGGVTMSLGYALTEDFPLREGKPLARFGTLGLFRAPQTPDINALIIEKNDSELAHGAKGIGEICSIPTAPAVALAYENRDGLRRTSLPLEGTPYSRKKRE
ncbi:MAG: selenium-dependent xanthine dehydrogenase [Clostridia bacterium]|nr:selenium-dependent xanthine dehydrogenase [Clostridia bacterium]